MSLLALLARRGGATAPPPITPAATYNAADHLTTPTYDGSGNTVHPDVVDMALHGLPSWGGFRFWMLHTPYPNSNEIYENPAILASHDGLTWTVPTGLTRDPLYPKPEQNWNSDTDLVYDPATGELVAIFRSYGNGHHQHVYARSADGITWPATATPLHGWVEPMEQSLSPAVVRMADGTWAMWGIGVGARTLRRWTAPAPEGPYGQPVTCRGIGRDAWHLDVTRVGNRLHALIDVGRERAWMPDDPQGLYAATSLDDGLNWSLNPNPLITIGGDGWDNFDSYRGSLQLHDDGDKFRVWYPGRSGTGPANSWHIGYTEIPLSEWPLAGTD